MIYVIHMTITSFRNIDGVSSHIVHQIPTFFLDGDIQGITNTRQAEEVAKSLYSWIGAKIDYRISVTAREAELIKK